MWKDPIVEEIHAVREKIEREFDYDLRRIMDYLREKEKQHPERLVTMEDIRRAREAAHSPEESRKDAA
jgi:hypothetical protein